MVDPAGTPLTAAEMVAKLVSRGLQLPTAKLLSSAISEWPTRNGSAAKSNNLRRSIDTPCKLRGRTARLGRLHTCGPLLRGRIFWELSARGSGDAERYDKA